MNNLVTAYWLAYHIAYLLISIGLTSWAAIGLHRNCRLFLLEESPEGGVGTKSVAQSVALGFCGVTAGGLILTEAMTWPISDIFQLLQALAIKLGIFLLIAGAAYLMALLVFTRIRRTARRDPRHGESMLA